MEPPKYVLLSYDAEAEFNGQDGYEETWATCADTEGLFGDPPPPRRGTYELLGCAPEGGLRTALARARADGSAPLGSLALETLDKNRDRVGDWPWALENARVLGDRPCARDLTLRDITIEASESVDNGVDYPQCPPLSPGYRLLGGDEESWGTCRDLAHVRRQEPELLEVPPLRLLGCAPSGALRAALDAGEEDLGHAKVLRIDVHGRTVQPAVEGELTAWIPSARGRGLIDLTLEPWSERPPTAAPEVWDLWWQGRPSEPGLWARCSTEGRGFWLDTARVNHVHGLSDQPSGTVYHLDGRHITDKSGFFCALGEAVNGPGGYFGWGVDALNDCLRGRWGAEWPFTLVWHDVEVARTCLGVTPHADYGPPTFEELLAFLIEKGIEVRLA